MKDKKYIWLVIICILIILASIIIYFINTKNNSSESENNSQDIEIKHPNGVIFDSEGRIIEELSPQN